MNIILTICLIGVLVFITAFALNRLSKPSVSGILKIDHSDPDGPYLFLELEEHVDVVQRKKFVILKVDISNHLSQH